jgi:hypothetical protein
MVDTDWAEAHSGANGVVLVEVDEQADAYAVNHLPKAVGCRREFVDKDGFEGLLSHNGIANDDTVVLNNWFAVRLDGASTIVNCCIADLSARSQSVLNELQDGDVAFLRNPDRVRVRQPDVAAADRRPERRVSATQRPFLLAVRVWGADRARGLHRS